MSAPVFAANVASSAADDEREFRLVVRRFGYFRKHDLVARTYNGGRELIEDCRDIRNRRVRLLRVVAIVQAHTKQFSRPRNGRQKLYFAQAGLRTGGRFLGESASIVQAFGSCLNQVQ